MDHQLTPLHISNPNGGDTTSTSSIVTVRPVEDSPSVQGLPNFIGISAETAGSTRLAMNIVVIPPGVQAKAHFHDGYETAIYILQGRVETLYGDGLCQSVVHTAGDFVFIPPCVPHQPRNLSDCEPALAIVARNDPREQESVVLYDALARTSVTVLTSAPSAALEGLDEMDGKRPATTVDVSSQIHCRP